MDVNLNASLDDVQPEDLDTGPIVVLNLLHFKTDESVASYIEYAVRVLQAFGDQGVEVVYAGKLKEKLQGEIGDWEVVLLVRYPSRRVFYEMLRSDKYQGISPLREAALDNGVVWPSEPVMPYKTQSVEFEGGEWLELIQSMQS